MRPTIWAIWHESGAMRSRSSVIPVRLPLCLLAVVAGWGVAAPPAVAAPRTVRVFVALCDNASQGIQPVPARIGDGDKPDDNLYWGCDEGFASVFRKAPGWKIDRREDNPAPGILRRLVLTHAASRTTLQADAYQGRAIRRCLADFEACLAGGQCDLAAYLGHNGLMDFDLDPPAAGPKGCDAIVLCCKSQEYFHRRLAALKARPLLLTRQFMYPGSFLLRDALAVWIDGGSPDQIRAAAARAYARNQGVSFKAALGVFAPAPPAP